MKFHDASRELMYTGKPMFLGANFVLPHINVDILPEKGVELSVLLPDKKLVARWYYFRVKEYNTVSLLLRAYHDDPEDILRTCFGFQYQPASGSNLGPLPSLEELFS